MGGTMDGANTRTPIGYGTWSQTFEPNISLRMENIGSTDVVNPWVIVNGTITVTPDGHTGTAAGEVL